MLCSKVQENGMTDTVCTLFELRAGDDTVNEGKLMNKQTSDGNWVKFGHFAKLQHCSVMSNGHADATILVMSKILEDAIVILLLLL